MTRHPLFALPSALLLSFFLAIAPGGCSKRSRPITDPSGFENALGAAAVEALIAKTKAHYAGEEPLTYALVIGERLAPSSPAFLERFRAQGHAFIDWDELDYDRVTKATVIKGTRTNPVVLQLIKISQITETEHQLATAWNRGAEIVRTTFSIHGHPDGESLEVEELDVQGTDESTKPAQGDVHPSGS